MGEAADPKGPNRSHEAEQPFTELSIENSELVEQSLQKILKAKIIDERNNGQTNRISNDTSFRTHVVKTFTEEPDSTTEYIIDADCHVGAGGRYLSPVTINLYEVHSETDDVKAGVIRLLEAKPINPNTPVKFFDENIAEDIIVSFLSEIEQSLENK